MERLHAEMTRITGDAAFQKRVSDVGLMPLAPRSIADIEKYIKGERDRWSAVVTHSGLQGRSSVQLAIFASLCGELRANFAI